MMIDNNRISVPGFRTQCILNFCTGTFELRSVFEEKKTNLNLSILFFGSGRFSRVGRGRRNKNNFILGLKAYNLTIVHKTYQIS